MKKIPSGRYLVAVKGKGKGNIYAFKTPNQRTAFVKKLKALKLTYATLTMIKKIKR